MAKTASEAITVGGTGIPALESFPDYVAARDRLRAIAEEHGVAAATLKRANSSLSNMARVRAEAVDEAARARIEDKQAPQRVVHEHQRQELRFQVDTLEGALVQQTALVDEVRDRCVQEILKVVAPRRRAMIVDVLEKLNAVADALDAEAAFVNDCQRAGVNFAYAEAMMLNGARHKIGSRLAWGSFVNEFARRVADYIGRPWDHSRIVR